MNAINNDSVYAILAPTSNLACQIMLKRHVDVLKVAGFDFLFLELKE